MKCIFLHTRSPVRRRLSITSVKVFTISKRAASRLLNAGKGRLGKNKPIGFNASSNACLSEYKTNNNNKTYAIMFSNTVSHLGTDLISEQAATCSQNNQISKALKNFQLSSITNLGSIVGKEFLAFFNHLGNIELKPLWAQTLAGKFDLLNHHRRGGIIHNTLAEDWDHELVCIFRAKFFIGSFEEELLAFQRNEVCQILSHHFHSENATMLSHLVICASYYYATFSLRRVTYSTGSFAKFKNAPKKGMYFPTYVLGALRGR